MMWEFESIYGEVSVVEIVACKHLDLGYRFGIKISKNNGFDKYEFYPPNGRLRLDEEQDVPKAIIDEAILQLKRRKIMNYKEQIKDLKKEQKELQHKIDVLEKSINEDNKSKYPKCGTIYYYINTYGKVICYKWIDSAGDKQRFAIGNYFETREEAEFQAERLKVIAELKRFAEPKDRAWDGENKHWYICYGFDDRILQYFDNFSFKQPGIYFVSEVDARKAVEAVGVERVKKYYLEVTE